MLTLRVIPQIAEIPREAWDALVRETSSPFVEHTWLSCLEEAGCAGNASRLDIHVLSQVFCDIFGPADFGCGTTDPLMVGNRGASATGGQRSNDCQPRQHRQ